MQVWQDLSNRLAHTREGGCEAQLLLTAVKLAISGLKAAPVLPDGR